jgi:hypothetical protein
VSNEVDSQLFITDDPDKLGRSLGPADLSTGLHAITSGVLSSG